MFLHTADQVCPGVPVTGVVCVCVCVCVSCSAYQEVSVYRQDKLLVGVCVGPPLCVLWVPKQSL